MAVNIAKNPSFENGWTQTVPTSGNQTPNEWNVSWADVGDPMLSAGFFQGEDLPIIDVVNNIPECVHLNKVQLPSDEWPGAEDALILNGDWVYKAFGVACSITLWQELQSTPGKSVVIKVPVQVHYHGDGSFGACAIRLWANEVTQDWKTFHAGLPDPANPSWVILVAKVTLSDDGFLEFGLDMEGRAETPISFFIDDVSVELVEETTPPPTPSGTVPYYNRIKYDKVVHVPAQDCSEARFLEIARIAYRSRSTISGSADDALGHEPGQNAKGIFYDVSPTKRQDYLTFRDTHYPGAAIVFNGAVTPWSPIRYVEKGTALGFHAIGGCPVDLEEQLYNAGVTLSSIKFVQAIGDLNITTAKYKLARMIDYAGVPLEGFDYDGNPTAQAEARMAALLPLFAPYRDKLSFIEIINEQKPPTPAQHVQLGLFFMRAMDIAEENGFKLALFSHSVGVPEPGAWDVVAGIGIFERAAAGGHAISLHEYCDASYGPNHVTCRFRDLYERIILPKQLNIPLFVTEYNVPDEMLGGDVFGQWVMYDRLAREYPFVAGVEIFTLGSGMGWDNYVRATVEQFARFKDYAIAQKDVRNG